MTPPARRRHWRIVHRVNAGATDEQVGAGAAVQDIVALTADQRVVAAGAVKPVVAARAFQMVGQVLAVEDVVPTEAEKKILRSDNAPEDIAIFTPMMSGMIPLPPAWQWHHVDFGVCVEYFNIRSFFSGNARDLLQSDLRRAFTPSPPPPQWRSRPEDTRRWAPPSPASRRRRTRPDAPSAHNPAPPHPTRARRRWKSPAPARTRRHHQRQRLDAAGHAAASAGRAFIPSRSKAICTGASPAALRRRSEKDRRAGAAARRWARTSRERSDRRSMTRFACPCRSTACGFGATAHRWRRLPAPAR